MSHLFFLRFFSAVILLVQVLCFVGPCKRSAAGRGRSTTTTPGGGFALPGLQNQKNSDEEITKKQRPYSGFLVRLKIAEAFPEGRGEAQGCAERAQPAGMQAGARPESLKE
ncbi:hypothetical protein [Leclercia adecarboxylata]|uniref:hypothetical protein n=1 Tax=Leclercia adecarboxylata TaxID=83655 RepID=UPI002B2F48C4|nr:hypothetical protein NRF19_04700 [Leclercia adecarboxylata]